ncbi:MAG: class I SAM-dependent methyltransferase [Pseudomonadota bacterium]
MRIPDLRNILTFPAVYTWFQRAVRGNGDFVYTTRHIRAEEGDRVLDIGCGTGEILRHMPKVDYFGFDMDEKFIGAANEAYGNRGTFLCRHLAEDAVGDFSTFDIVCATGVLHHLDDEEAGELFRLARRALKPGRRLVTLDSCFVDGQSFLTRFTSSIDRGKYVRKSDEYVALASQVFREVKPTIYPALFRIPQFVIIMECRD